MKYCVCIDAVFMNKGNIVEAMKRVKNCGYDAIEFWTWWDKDMESVIRAQQELDLQVATFCAEFIEPGDAKNHNAYIESLKTTIRLAKRMKCSTIIVQAGWSMDAIPFAEHRKNILTLFKKIAPIAEAENIILVIEPLNKLVNHPTYHLSTSQDAFAIIDQVQSSNIKILFDIYHQQITEGNLIANISNNIEKIGHFHAAGNPGRSEITKGEIHYKHIFESIDNTGYQGYIGLEYMTEEEPELGLREARRLFV